MAEASPIEFDRQETGTKIRLATEEPHGIQSAVVKGIIHVTGAGLMTSHVTETDVRGERCLQAGVLGTGRTGEVVSVRISASVCQ